MTLDCTLNATLYLLLCFVVCDKKWLLATSVSRIVRILNSYIYTIYSYFISGFIKGLHAFGLRVTKKLMLNPG